MSGGLLLLWYCYQISLFWFDPHIAFFSAASSRARLERHFRVLLYTQNISMSQVESISFSTRFTLSYYNCQFKKISQYLHDEHLLNSHCFQFYRFRCSRCWWWWWDTTNEHVNLWQLVLRTTRQGSTTGTLTDLVFHDVRKKISLNWIILIDDSQRGRRRWLLWFWKWHAGNCCVILYHLSPLSRYGQFNVS